MPGDGSFPALGSHFVAFRRVLTSKSVPSADTLIGFLVELRASGFDWLADQLFKGDDPGFSAKYATWLLITGIASDLWRKDGQTPGIDTAVKLLGGRWQVVRGELVKFAAMLVEEMEKVRAAEARLHKTEAQPQEPESDHALSDRQCDILDALAQRKAVDSERRLSTDEIAELAEGRHANSESFKHPIADLKRRGLIETKRGRNGGCWLTDSGRKFTSRRKNT